MDNQTEQYREAKSFLMIFLVLLVKPKPVCDNNLLDNVLVSYLHNQRKDLTAHTRPTLVYMA